MVGLNNSANKKKVLLLCHYYPGVAGAINDHIMAFDKYSGNEYFILSNLGDLPDWLDLFRFDALIFHYSLIACYDNYISPAGRARIREFQGFKAAFVQDDYRWINDTVNALSYMGIHALFPLTGPDIMDAVYSPDKLPNVRKETVLAGYVPQELVGLEVKSYKDRQVDVGYRARKLPAWMGSHTLQKWQIAERFLEDAPGYGLKVDISCREEDRIYGDAWVEFVMNCKATLGTESGASVCDFTGDIQRKVEAHLKADPDADFNTLRNLYFKDDDCKHMMNVISPRCFESAALRTLMILYEGHYSGVLIPWRHYVPLKRDHSNIAEVVKILRTSEEAQKIIDQAYREVAMNEAYSYRAMVQLVDRVMDEEWEPSMTCRNVGFSREEFEWCREKKPQGHGGTSSAPGEVALWLPAGRQEVSGMRDGSWNIKLGSLKNVSSIAIRWEERTSDVPDTIRIKGMRKGSVEEYRTMPNDGHGAFQVVELRPPMQKIDSLVLCSDKRDAQLRILTVSVLASDASLARRVVFESRAMSGILLHRCWAAMPEWCRRILRPYVRGVRSVFARMVG